MKEQEKANRYVAVSANEHGVKFIRLWFTDILGNLKGFAITVDELEEVLSEETVFVAVPIRQFKDVINNISPKLKPGQTVIDVCSVKNYPVDIMRNILVKIKFDYT